MTGLLNDELLDKNKVCNLALLTYPAQPIPLTQSHTWSRKEKHFKIVVEEFFSIFGRKRKEIFSKKSHGRPKDNNYKMISV